MDRGQDFCAADAVNGLEKNVLSKILYTYGEERFSELIVREIIRSREREPIKTTRQLADIVKYAVRNIKYTGGHPAKRTFQAIRIYVNREIENIEPALDSVESMLISGGRLAVISFHSGEDRIVKQRFNFYEKDCRCPPGLPVCACDKRATSKVLTKKPVYPGRREIEINPPSESAKLRAIEKL
jgi:16S rRNA (cytosine1402-N4)-methyltransferase